MTDRLQELGLEAVEIFEGGEAGTCVIFGFMPRGRVLEHGQEIVDVAGRTTNGRRRKLRPSVTSVTTDHWDFKLLGSSSPPRQVSQPVAHLQINSYRKVFRYRRAQQEFSRLSQQCA